MQDIIKDIFEGRASSAKKPIIKAIPIPDYPAQYNGCINIAKYLEPKYKETDVNRDLIKHLICYFTGRQTNKNFDFSKGICLVGGVGSGKSLIFDVMKFWASNVLQNNSFQIHSYKNILDNYKINANYITELEKKTIYIDDMFCINGMTNVYGTNVDVASEIINSRHKELLISRKLTHCTSNMYPVDLCEKKILGEREYSRFQEMFNVIELLENDWRITK